MKLRLRRFLAVVLAASWFAIPFGVSAKESGTTQQGWPYVSGGVSHEELVELHGHRGEYSLWIVTAAMKSGAYLADARITIRDRKDRRVVFDRPIDGPWLFIALPLGSYEIEAALKGQSQRRFTTIHRGDHHQAFFYFDVADTVSPEERRPFDRSPYGAPKN